MKMKLLDVEGVLNRDKGIQRAGHKPEVMKERDDTTTRYAILSHRWGAEVNYEEMTGLMKMEEEEREEVKKRHGYQKIVAGCEQAIKDGYEWLWVDTCCIDKRSSAELSEAINSMYRWYQNAQVCYAYLNDVGESTFPTKKDDNKFAESNGWPEWFMRGWTLQELIAPKEVKFFNKDWVHIGNKRQLEPILEKATGIPRAVLRNGIAGRRVSVATIMSWAAERRTTRVEDRAYSLMGLFGVYMPMLYGEGKMAFQRLQLEIIRRSSDQSIFAWKPQIPRIGSVLADDPCDFRNCGGIEKVEPDRLGDRLMEYIGWLELGHPWYIRRTSFKKIATNPVHWCRLAWLRWRARTLNRQLYSFTVSNAGIQVCLPVIPIPDSRSHYRALLACTYGWSLISIDLVSTGSSFDRIPYIHTTPKTYPEFKTFYLASHQDVNEKRRTFILDDKHASYHGFKRCATYPRESMGDAVTLSSLTSDLVVVVYANSDTGFCFVVGLGYHYGQDWVHVDYDEHSSTEEENWTNFGSRAYNRMWEARSTHARDVAEDGPVRYDQYCMKHAHFPRSTKGVRVVWGRWEDDFKAMVDVVDCPGCCDGPRKTTITSNDRYGLTMPGLMRTVSYSYSLRLDEELAPVDDCSGLRLALGDYGDYSCGDFVRTGNIFDDMRVAGIGLEDSTHSPIVFRELSARLQADRNQGDLAIARSYSSSKKYLALHQPRVLSLPANERVSLLLKALSTRLVGKHLVIAIMQCRDFYMVDEDGKRRDSGDHSAPASGNHSTETGRLTPLCTIVSPQVWRRELPCLQRMARFKSIR
ncbi:heterokaryon incompatibility protein-domain-containing protein [Pisolithus albus]|nr:heterokaryon incompatibility protein-domain-containing protein [Pisolithus albus]